MSFDSLTYLYFLPVVWLVYLILNHRWQNLMLVGASYVFYGSWDMRFLFLIILSTAIDFCCGLLIDKDQIRKQQYLTASTAVVCGLVGFLLLPAWWTSGMQILEMPEQMGWITLAVTLLLCILPFLYRLMERLEKEVRKKVFLCFSVVSNLSILGFFKYFDFFISSAESLFRSVGVTNVDLLHLNIVLPVGISFYTFQTLSYSLGIYRGELKASTNYVGFSLFVGYFPQLVAGPIERASHLLPALLAKRNVTVDCIKHGVFLILLGLFKKVGISNGLAGSVDSIYNSTGNVSSLDVTLATLCFALQIYCDFSGYSDIARGSSRLFGIRLIRNFEQPYFSRNPSEFWRRWHISLSSWLRDYLYISLGGNRNGNLKTYRNLMLTMVLGGLWHGAAVNFILWGAYQGTMLCVHRYMTRAGAFFSRFDNQILSYAYIPIFFVFTCYGWLLFRVTSLEQIVELTNSLLTLDFSVSMKRPTFSAVVGVPILLLVDLYANRTGLSNPFRKSPSFVQGLFYSGLLLVFFMGLSNAPTQFIYFQF